MKKLCLTLLIVVILGNLVSCKTETITLCCDGEACSNTVEIEVKNNVTPDESWIVFCQDCANNVLAD